MIKFFRDIIVFRSCKTSPHDDYLSSIILKIDNLEEKTITTEKKFSIIKNAILLPVNNLQPKEIKLLKKFLKANQITNITKVVYKNQDDKILEIVGLENIERFKSLQIYQDLQNAIEKREQNTDNLHKTGLIPKHITNEEKLVLNKLKISYNKICGNIMNRNIIPKHVAAKNKLITNSIQIQYNNFFKEYSTGFGRK